MSLSTLVLNRFPEYADTTPGEILFEGKRVCYTIELPWKGNASNISCIPKGIYKIAYTKSTRFGRILLQVLDVPGRSGVRVHTANYSHELEGCIAPASVLKIINGNVVMGATSGNALKLLDNVIKKYKLTTLEIR